MLAVRSNPTGEPASLNARLTDARLPLDGIQLLLFDFDGVVADSELISLNTLAETLTAFEITMAIEEVRARFLGTSIRTILEYIAAHGTGDRLEDFVPKWHEMLFQRFSAELAPVPFVLEFIAELSDAGTAYCIASSGTFERIAFAMRAMGIEDRFDHVFSAEEVDHGKPAPDLFLLASQRMGVTPRHCLVIEDSPFGVQAAKAAGMRCAGFVGGAHLADVREAHAEILLDAGAEMVLEAFNDVSLDLHGPVEKRGAATR